MTNRSDIPDPVNLPSDVYIMSDDHILQGFGTSAPIHRLSDDEIRALPLSDPGDRYTFALLYFTLGVRYAEHVQKHHEWNSRHLNPDSPQIALPGIDFPTAEVLAEHTSRLRNRGRKRDKG